MIANRQTDTLITILRSPIGDGVKIVPAPVVRALLNSL